MSTTTTYTDSTGDTVCDDCGDIILSWFRGRDDYGRTCHTLHRWGRPTGRNGAVGVVVRLPKSAQADHAAGRHYLINAWGQGFDPGHGLVTFAATLAEAKARLLDQTA